MHSSWLFMLHFMLQNVNCLQHSNGYSEPDVQQGVRQHIPESILLSKQLCHPLGNRWPLPKIKIQSLQAFCRHNSSITAGITVQTVINHRLWAKLILNALQPIGTRKSELLLIGFQLLSPQLVLASFPFHDNRAQLLLVSRCLASVRGFF